MSAALRRGPARVGAYAFVLASALFFLLPLYLMLVTSFKPMHEIRAGALFALPGAPSLDAWRQAWSGACNGNDCEGLHTGLFNSIAITLPSTVLPIALGALNGYALSFWRARRAEWLFALLMVGAFVPAQVMIYPLVRMTALLGVFGTLPGIVLVHTIFGMPILTLLFRNYYAGIPRELFNAARIDGGGFLRIFVHVALPMSVPAIAVAAILQATGVWNDYLLGLVFAGRGHAPVTVQLNNLINSDTGARLYNVNMAAAILASLLPLALYFLSGRWFVRGITAGAVKG